MDDLNKSCILFFTISINETIVGPGHVLLKSSGREVLNMVEVHRAPKPIGRDWLSMTKRKPNARR